MAGIRAEIAAATGCAASAGIAPNLLLARIASERAKPDGQLRVTQAEAREYLQARAAPGQHLWAHVLCSPAASGEERAGPMLPGNLIGKLTSNALLRLHTTLCRGCPWTCCQGWAPPRG